MKVNEIFYSLQGEGYYTGTPAVFVRLSGCNMHCDFCDTDHSNFTDMTEAEIVDSVCSYPARHVVITGGEPTLQLTQSLVESLHNAGRYIQIETNGSIALDHAIVSSIDWVTCSPKSDTAPVIGRIDELKVLFDIDHTERIEQLESVAAGHYSLQPCDRHDPDRNRINTTACVDYILNHPRWRLSLQTHKLLDIK